MVSPPPPAPEDVPITSSRAMRLAVTRAADKVHDLTLSVIGLREEQASLEAMLDMIAPDDMLISMMQGNDIAGLATLDLQTRAALIEVQTLGCVLATPPDDRAPTRTDAAMAIPLLQAILTHLHETAGRTPLEGWGQGIIPQGQVTSARAAGLILPERNYRVVRISLDFQVPDRQGSLMLALPDHKEAPPVSPLAAEDTDWETQFQAMVNAAPVRLQAQLHRFKVPLFVAEGLSVGQVLPLPGCQVTSVKLRAADGKKVATARLGQSGGMRAIRVEAPVEPDLQALGQFGSDDMASDVDLDLGDLAEDNAFEMEGLTEIDAAEVAEAEEPDETAQMLDDMEAALVEESEPAAEAAPLSWDMEDLEDTEDGGMADLDWSAEGFDAPGEET